MNSLSIFINNHDFIIVYSVTRCQLTGILQQITTTLDQWRGCRIAQNGPRTRRMVIPVNPVHSFRASPWSPVREPGACRPGTADQAGRKPNLPCRFNLWNPPGGCRTPTWVPRRRHPPRLPSGRPGKSALRWMPIELSQPPAGRSPRPLWGHPRDARR